MKPSEYVAKGWCQGVTAKDSRNFQCAPYSSDAVRWCLIGAIAAAYPEQNYLRSKVVTKLVDKLGHLRFAAWNDDPKRTQVEVIALLQSIGE